MSTPPDHACYRLDMARLLLQDSYRERLCLEEIDRLAEEIAPYVMRSKRPFDVAVVEIAHNYVQDGPAVRALLANEYASEWEDVMIHVVNFAMRNPQYPEASEANSWPDLDAYADIRAKLRSYNFEGPLRHWINATVAQRIVRYRRDQQALRVGGRGFQPRPQSGSSVERDQRVYVLSLEGEDENGTALGDTLEAKQATVDQQVEERSLLLAMREVIAQLAREKHDPWLLPVWIKHLEQQHKLRDVADELNLSLGQVARRVTIMRTHLQKHPMIQSWFS